MTDIIEAMASPNVDATAGTNAVVEHAIACQNSGINGSKLFLTKYFHSITIFWGSRRQATGCPDGEIEITHANQEKCVKIGKTVNIRVCPDDSREYCDQGYVFFDNKNNGSLVCSHSNSFYTF